MANNIVLFDGPVESQCVVGADRDQQQDQAIFDKDIEKREAES
jgi:hypothetical protein